MSQITHAMRELARDPDVVIVCLNDRFSHPKNGWADVSMYIAFSDPLCGQAIGEVQLVHRKLMLVREEMGAHEAYSSDRFAAELLKISAGTSTAALPWSQQGESR